jgi:hypothetical protein
LATGGPDHRLVATLGRLGAVDLKARGWEIEAPRRSSRPLRRERDPADDQPPWHQYGARELAQLIDSVGAHQHGSWWRCKCPVHNGKSNTSLVIRDTEEGHPGWHCFADCSDRDVAAAIAEILK